MNNEETLKAFAMMDIQNQHLFIAAKGIFLLSIADGNTKRFLYACENFFVEYHYFVLDPYTIIMYVFDDTHALDPYVKDVDLDSLLNGINR